MREQKYANILEDDTKVVETEEKLSMTRELKFKEIQEQIEEEKEKKLSMTRELKFKEIQDSLDNTDMIEDELEKSVEEIKNLKREENIDDTVKIRQVNKNTDLEDLYLTTSFKPFRKRFRLKKVFKVLFLLIFWIGTLAALGYFVVYPLYRKYVESNPVFIFKGTVSTISEYLEKTSDIILSNDKSAQYELKLNIDSDMKELEMIQNKPLVYRYGFNYKDNIFQEDIYVNVDNNNYGFNRIKNNGNYYKYSSSSNYLEEKNIDNEEFFSPMFNMELNYSNYTKNEINYLINKETKIIKSLIKKEYIESNLEDIEINGDIIKVIRNSLVLDNTNYEKVIKKYNEEVLKDNRLIEILAKFNQVSVNEYKNNLEKDIVVDKDFKLVFNIYTIYGTKVIGIDIEINGFRDYYIYFNEGKYEIHANVGNLVRSITDSKKDKLMVLDLTGKYNKKEITGEFNYNTKKILDIKIDEYSEEKISINSMVYHDVYKKIDLDLIVKDYNIVGNVVCKDFTYDIDFIKLNRSDFGYVDNENIVTYNIKNNNREAATLEDELKKVDALEAYLYWNNYLNSINTLYSLKTS